MCAAGGAVLFAGLGVPRASAQTARHHYGSHARQSLQLQLPQEAGPWPLVVLVGDDGPVSAAQAQPLVRRGMAVARIDRRGQRHGLNPHTADVALALSYLMARKDAVGLDGRIAFWGEGRGAEAVMLTLRDRRYLGAVGLNASDVWGAVLLRPTSGDDASFTRASAYGSQEPAGVFRTEKAADGAAFLSGLF